MPPIGVHIRSDTQFFIPKLVDEVVYLCLVRREEVVGEAVVVHSPERYCPALLVRVHVPGYTVAHVVAAAQDGIAVGRIRGVVVIGALGTVQAEKRYRVWGLGVGGEDVCGDALGSVAVREKVDHLGSVGRVEVVGRCLAPRTEEGDSRVPAGRHCC